MSIRLIVDEKRREDIKEEVKRDLLRRYIRRTLEVEVESSRMDEGGEQINRELQRRKGV